MNNVTNINESFITEIDINRFKTQIKNGKTREIDYTIKTFFAPGSCSCENDVVKYKFLKLILKQVSHNPELSKTMLFKFREVFGLPDRLPTKEFKETVTLTCNEEETENEKSSFTVSKKFLMMTAEHYMTMFTSNFKENCINEVKTELCREALFALKNYIYNQKIGNISLEALLELHSYADSIQFPDLFNLTKTLLFKLFVKSENATYLTKEIIKFLKQHSKEFTEISLQSMNVEIEPSTEKNNRHFTINLTDFIFLFKNVDPRILNIWAREISTLKIDTNNFSLLGTIPKQYRRAITTLVNPNSLKLSIQDFEKLVFSFPNIYDQGDVFNSPTFKGLFQEQESNELPNYWSVLRKGECSLDIEEFTKAIELDHTLPHAHFHLGTFLFEGDGNLKRGARAFDEALKADPKCSDALSIYGKNLLYEKDENTEENVAKGFAYLKKNIRINPKEGLGYLFLYKAYIRKGDLEGATRVLEKQIKYASEKNNSTSIDNLISCYLKLGEYQNIVNFYNDTDIDLSKAQSHFNNYCYALIMIGDLKKAEELLHKSKPPHLGCLILLLIKQNRLEEVYNLIKDIESRYLDDLTHFALGDYFIAVNDLKNALKHYIALSVFDRNEKSRIEKSDYNEPHKIRKMDLEDTQGIINFLRKMKVEAPIHRVAFHSTLKEILERLDPTSDKMESTSEVEATPEIENTNEASKKRKRTQEPKDEKKIQDTKKFKEEKKKELEIEKKDKNKGKEKVNK